MGGGIWFERVIGLVGWLCSLIGDFAGLDGAFGIWFGRGVCWLIGVLFGSGIWWKFGYCKFVYFNFLGEFVLRKDC